MALLQGSFRPFGPKVAKILNEFLGPLGPRGPKIQNRVENELKSTICQLFWLFRDSVLDFLGPPAPRARFGFFMLLLARRAQMTPVAGKSFCYLLTFFFLGWGCKIHPGIAQSNSQVILLVMICCWVEASWLCTHVSTARVCFGVFECVIQEQLLSNAEKCTLCTTRRFPKSMTDETNCKIFAKIQNSCAIHWKSRSFPRNSRAQTCFKFIFRQIIQFRKSFQSEGNSNGLETFYFGQKTAENPEEEHSNKNMYMFTKTNQKGQILRC